MRNGAEQEARAQAQRLFGAGRGGAAPIGRGVTERAPKAPLPNARQVTPAPLVDWLPPPALPGSAPRQRRHRLLLGSALLFILMPALLLAAYLYLVVPDQYASVTAFSVRQEEPASAAAEMLGGFAGLARGSSSDMDVLYAFIRSQDMVARIDARLDLRAIYAPSATARWPDPLFTLPADATIEQLRDHWRRVVRLDYDQGEGLIEVTVVAFSATDARRVAEAVLAESTTMINALADAAREDATRVARDELGLAEQRLAAARRGLTAFRDTNQLVDPTADLQSRMGVIDTLNTQLAEALIELDLLRRGTSADDARIRLRQDKIAVIEARLAEERRKLGAGPGNAAGDTPYAGVMERYEALSIERDFAEQAWVSARTAFEAARSEAARQSRYLAAHIRPTLAQTAEYPRRWLILGLAVLFLALSWVILALGAWSMRDQR